MESPKKEKSVPYRFTTEIYQIFKEELTSILLKFFHEIGKETAQHSMKPGLHSSPSRTRALKKKRTTVQSL
jgi:lysyl-tRNA synthetase class I